MGKVKKKVVIFNIPLLLLFIFIFIFILINSLVQAATSSSSRMKRVGTEAGEMEMEINRRALWTAAGDEPHKRYISYGALKGDNVPCDRPGIPYYNCRALPEANPYSRGCSIITDCRN